jgi:hypothetical protein
MAVPTFMDILFPQILPNKAAGHTDVSGNYSLAWAEPGGRLKLTSVPGAILAWRHSSRQTKGPGEVCPIRKTHIQCDVSDGSIGMSEFLASRLNAESANVLSHTAPVV